GSPLGRSRAVVQDELLTGGAKPMNHCHHWGDANPARQEQMACCPLAQRKVVPRLGDCQHASNMHALEDRLGSAATVLFALNGKHVVTAVQWVAAKGVLPDPAIAEVEVNVAPRLE